MVEFGSFHETAAIEVECLLQGPFPRSRPSKLSAHTRKTKKGESPTVCHRSVVGILRSSIRAEFRPHEALKQSLSIIVLTSLQEHTLPLLDEVTGASKRVSNPLGERQTSTRNGLDELSE